MHGSLPPSLVEAAVLPDDVAAWAAVTIPDAAVTGPLVALNPRRLSAAGRVDALAALERQIAWLQARQLRLLAVMAGTPDPDTPLEELDRDWVREDVAVALRLSPGTAADRLELARELTRLPATMASLERGELTIHHARALAEVVTTLDGPTAAAVEAEVLARAAGQTLTRFRRAVARAVLAAAPARADERHVQAMRERRVAITPVADGMSEQWALLPADSAAAIDSLLTRHAATHDHAAAHDPDDTRTLDQRRADALVDLLLGRGQGAAGGARPLVQVTVALSTLLGVDEQPGQLDGYGPIPAALSRRRGGCHRHLAAPGHRRPRPATRLRAHQLPTAGEPHRPRAGPRRHVPVSHLHPSRATLPAGPRHRLERRRRHQPAQPAGAVRQTPQAQAPHPMAGAPRT